MSPESVRFQQEVSNGVSWEPLVKTEKTTSVRVSSEIGSCVLWLARPCYLLGGCALAAPGRKAGNIF